MSYLEIAKSAIHNARAREELNHFFVEEILPRLSRLYTSGRLPDLTQETLWTAMETEWLKAGAASPVSCDTEEVIRLMRQWIWMHEQGKRQTELF